MRKITSLLVITMLLFSLCLAFTGCNSSPGNAPDVSCSLHFEPEDLPVIDGATALAPYYELMASKLLDMELSEAKTWVLCSRTDGAYENLIYGAADMIFVSMPSEEQQTMADEEGFEFEMTPFLNGGFVFFVNKSNPVDSLTVQQLHDIYAGKITNWKEVGGDDLEIIAYQRPNNSGSQTGMYNYIISEDEIMHAPTEKKIEGMGEIVDAVAGYENSQGAIGYSYYYYVTSMHYSDDIKLLAIDGISPSDETIGNGTYPLINPSYVIIDKSTPADSPIRDIVQWIVGPEGQQTGKEAGYVPRQQ